MNIKKRGKQNRAKGKRFEERVRQNIMKHGFIPCRWLNNIDLEKKSLIPAKYSPFNRFTGFPDFEIYKPAENTNYYIVIGLECKSNGFMTKEEKEKCSFLLKNKIFNSIIVASKGQKRGEIIYKVIERGEI